MNRKKISQAYNTDVEVTAIILCHHISRIIENINRDFV